jgi:hypothetical protein
MRHRLTILSVVLLVLPGSKPALSAGDRPFKAVYDFVGTGAFPEDDTHVRFTGVLSGHATHLGRFVGETEYVVDVTTGTFDLTSTLVAANGDALSSAGSAIFTPIGGTPTGSIGTFEFTGGTGRFADASGTGAFIGVITGDGVGVLEANATISY